MLCKNIHCQMFFDIKPLSYEVQGMVGKLGLAAGLGFMAGPLFTPIIKQTNLIEKAF